MTHRFSPVKVLEEVMMRRLFLGIPLPDSYRELLDRMRRRWNGRLRSRLRWTRPENWHLTLVFFGGVESDVESQIVSALATVQFTPFALEGAGCGFFPARGRPRVAWLGVHGDVDRLSLLKGSIDSVLSNAGWEVDPRPFVPHLTLARIRDSRKDPWDEFGKDIQDVVWPRFTADSFILWESVLHPDGARYMTRKSYSALKVAE